MNYAVLIYDNFCSSCTRFANVSRMLSRRRILAVGHYTELGQRIKSEVFPDGFDPNTMFWLVTRNKAAGARSALLPLAAEILKGMLGIGRRVDAEAGSLACNASGGDCSTPIGLASRLAGLIRNGKKIERRSVTAS